jgi:hypothetical protein
MGMRWVFPAGTREAWRAAVVAPELEELSSDVSADAAFSAADRGNARMTPEERIAA